jgi:signal transduction histidine kinase
MQSSQQRNIPQLPSAQAADLLKQRKETVLRTWEKHVFREIPAARQVDRSALRGSLPSFIEEISQTLADGNMSRVWAAREEAGGARAAHRIDVAGHSFDQVLTECRLLRKAIFETLEKDAQLSKESRDIILETIELAIGDAAAVYVERQFARERQGCEQTEEINRRLHSLHAITEAALVSSVSLDNLLNDLCERIREIFDADTVAILLLTEDQKGLVLHAAYGLEQELIKKDVIPIDRDIAGRIMAERKPLLLEDLSSINISSESLRIQDARSLMGVPLRLTDRAIGVLLVGTLSERKFTECDTTQFEIIADRIATAIEHARLFEAARANIDHLETEKEIREAFVASLSHDLRTPLTSAKLSVQLAARAIDTPELRDRSLLRALDSMDRADRMIQNLLDASRVSAGQKLPLELDYVDLEALAQDVIDEACVVRGGHCRLAAGAPNISGYWSRDGLRRVLENLVSNARKYGRPGSLVTTTIEEIEDGNWVRISVHNDGEPIPMEMQAKLFEPFHRGTHAEKSGKRGWGLGLTIVRGIVQAHGGRIFVQSAADQGTTFFVDLPMDARSESLARGA